MQPYMLNPLATPACESCAGRTRFVGLETDPKHRGADLCTYECVACGHSQVTSIPRSDVRESESTRPRL
jgi:hypothetical protein